MESGLLESGLLSIASIRGRPNSMRWAAKPRTRSELFHFLSFDRAAPTPAPSARGANPGARRSANAIEKCRRSSTTTIGPRYDLYADVRPTARRASDAGARWSKPACGIHHDNTHQDQYV